MGEVGPVTCVGFLVGGTGACALVGGAVCCPSNGQGHISWCFGVSVGLLQLWASCLLMGGLVLLSSLLFGVGHSALGPACTWVELDLGVEMETSCRTLTD